MRRRSAISILSRGMGCIMLCGVPAGSAGENSAMKNVIVASNPGAFYGWPANNGAWTWEDGREILVGFSYGKFVEQEGHNTAEQKDFDGMARSLDGGVTWKIENPTAYVPDAVESSPPAGGIVFDAAGFVMRVKYGNFLVSHDRGKSWQGAYNFGDLTDTRELKDMRLTSRTGYIVTGSDSCLFFMSAQPGGKEYEDKSFVAETTDGGKTFRFISWIVPRDDPYRAVMPSPVRLADGTLAVALRRRIPQADDVCWVDCYGSRDNGRTWTFLSRIAETGKHNGSPPALAVLKDGRLACAYGDRTRIGMYLRLSNDGGKTWDNEILLRNDFRMDKFSERDFGYPCLVQNNKGELVALYYWATKELPQQQIAATIWRPSRKHESN